MLSFSEKQSLRADATHDAQNGNDLVLKAWKQDLLRFQRLYETVKESYEVYRVEFKIQSDKLGKYYDV